MIELNGKKLCSACVSEIEAEPCPYCGFSEDAAAGEPGVLPVGTILLGRYIVGRVLGRGGFGITYLGYDAKADKKIAIKEYLPDGISYRASDTTLVSTYMGEKEESFRTGAEKFFEEAKTVSRFNGNPNIVSVYEFFYENNTAYFVMEYLEGKNIKDKMKEYGGVLPEREVLRILNTVTDALLIAHSLGVLHRDISPDNIFLCNDESVKLIDFGAARQVIGEQSKSLSVILKQGFAPLEQYQRKGKQGPWTDIYALGATAYYALTGKTLDDPMSRLEEDNIGSAEAFQISPALWAIILKATAVRIDGRYQSVYEMKQDINALLTSVEQEAELAPAAPGAYPVSGSPASAAPADDKLGRIRALFSKKSVIAITSGCALVLVVLAVVIGIRTLRPETVPTGDGGGGGGAAQVRTSTTTGQTTADTEQADTPQSTDKDVPPGVGTSASTVPPGVGTSASTVPPGVGTSSTAQTTTTTTPASTTTTTTTKKPSTTTSKTTATTAPAAQNVYGNSNGNLANFGYFASSDGWLFYLQKETLQFHKMKPDGSQNTVLSSTFVQYMNVVGDWIYYCDGDLNDKIYKIKKNATSKTLVCDDSAQGMVILNNWIYYFNVSDNGKLYKVKIDGTGKTKLSNVSTYYDNYPILSVVDGWVYYNTQFDGELYKITTDGKNEKKLADASYSFVIGNGKIYYGVEGAIKVMNTDGTGVSVLIDDEPTYMNISGSTLYYTNWTDHRCLYKINTDGSGRTKLSPNGSQWTYIFDGWVYYSTDASGWYRIKLDGSSNELVG